MRIRLSVLVFTDNPNVWELGMVINALCARGAKVLKIAPWNLSIPEKIVRDYNLVYVPSNILHRGGTYELGHRLLLMREFEKQAYVINPVESILSYSKEHLTLTLKKMGLPHPQTISTENIEQAYDFAHQLLESGKEVVLKPVCGARGVGVTKLSEIRSRSDLLQFLMWYGRHHADGVFYLQEYKPNLGYDIRCLVINGKVVGREKRLNPNDFRYNVAVGGSAQAFSDTQYDELAIKVAEAVNLKITGIDILPGKDGEPYILEANCYPGYKALVEATGITIHEQIADYLISLTHN